MRNTTMLTDLYQLTMMNGYYKSGNAHKKAVFDLFFRQNGQFNYAIAAGLEQICEYIRDLRFTDEDIKYLKSLKIFDDGFLQYLRSFKFSGDIYAVKEGSIIFPDEPILILKGNLIEAQLLETSILNTINHQTLIATKTSKIAFAAGNADIIEFGARRAHGADAAVYGARAAIIGGCVGTSNVLAAQSFGLKPMGTQGHSWIMSYDSELDAFMDFAKIYPDNCLLLVDTYDTLGSGVPNAIKTFDWLKEQGKRPIGIRLDSGDLAYLSKKARLMLDNAGYSDAKIMASNDIDENLIMALNAQGAKIDAYGVGTKLITSDGMPSLGGVFKMSALQKGNELVPKMKTSNSILKATNPGFKELYRIYDKCGGMAIADLICLKGEALSEPLTLTHPLERWKKTILQDYYSEPMLVKIYENGQLIYDLPSVKQIVEYARLQKNRFWDEYKRLVNPHIYKVDLSDRLYELKQKLIVSR